MLLREEGAHARQHRRLHARHLVGSLQMSLILLGTSTYCCMYAFARLQQFASTPGFDLLSSLGTVPHLPLGQSHFNILTSVPPSAWLLRLCTSPEPRSGRRNFDFSVCVSPPLLFRPEADYQLSIIFAARSAAKSWGTPKPLENPKKQWKTLEIGKKMSFKRRGDSLRRVVSENFVFEVAKHIFLADGVTGAYFNYPCKVVWP